jgi:hypothetical protein
VFGKVRTSGPRGRDTQPVAVRVFQVALAPSETLFIDPNPELLSYRIDVIDVKVDQGAGRCVAGVFGEIEPNAPARDTDEPRESWLELMPPLLLESEPLVPPNGTTSVFHTENWHDRLIHRPSVNDPRAEHAPTPDRLPLYDGT